MSFTPYAERRWGIDKRLKVDIAWYENTLLTSALVGFLAGLVYFNTLSHGFVWDDHTYVLPNHQFKSGNYIFHYFVSDFCEGVHEDCFFYRPIVSLTYLLDFSLWGNNPFGYHLTNLIIHVFVSIFVYISSLLLFQVRWAAFFAGVLFAVHPIHTESIAFVAARTDPPATLFYLLSFIFFVRSLQKNSFQFRLVSLLCFGLGVMAKEIAITLPLTFVIYLLLFPSPVRKANEFFKRIKPSFPFWGLLSGYFVIRQLVFGQPLGGTSIYENLSGRLLTFPLLFLENLKMLFIPWPLTVFRSRADEWALSDPSVMLGIPIFFGIVLGFIAFGRKDGHTAFCFGWILITLLPVLNLVPGPWPAVWDRFLYLPSVGFCMMAGWWVYLFINSNFLFKALVYRRSLIVVFGGGVIGLGGITFDRNWDWKDNERFWGVTAEQIPSHTWAGAIARNNLAQAYRDQGNLPSVVKILEKVHDQHPNFLAAGINLGITYSEMGEHKKALHIYDSLLGTSPNNHQERKIEDKGFPGEEEKASDSSTLLYNLGITHLKLGNLQQGLEALKQSISKNPRNHLAYHSLGNIYFEKGFYQKAQEAYQASVRLDPTFGLGYKNLGRLLAFKGKFKEASIAYEAAIREGAHDKAVFQNLGWLYLELGEIVKAAQVLKKGVQLFPNEPSLRNNLGIAYYRLGENQLALKEYQEALILDPSNPEFKNNLGGVMESLDDQRGAMTAYQDAFSLRPDFLTAKINYGRMLMKTERLEEALQWYHAVLKEIPPTLEASSEIQYIRSQIRFLEDEKQMKLVQ